MRLKGKLVHSRVLDFVTVAGLVLMFAGGFSLLGELFGAFLSSPDNVGPMLAAIALLVVLSPFFFVIARRGYRYGLTLRPTSADPPKDVGESILQLIGIASVGFFLAWFIPGPMAAIAAVALGTAIRPIAALALGEFRP